MATAQQLKALRRKHHLGEFSHKRKVYKDRTSNKSMARRRYSTGKRKHRYSSGRRGGMNLWGSIIGVTGVVVYKSLLSQYIPLSSPIKQIVEIGAGIWMSKKGGWIGDTGKALVIIDAYQLMATYIAPTLSNLTGGSSTSSMTAFSYS